MRTHKIEELITLEKCRQEESDWILNNIKLLEKLKKYGEVRVTGAKELGLMVAKDIDISVVVDKISYKDWQELVKELMITPNIRKITAIDYYNYDEQNKYDPDNGMKYSLYISLDTLIGRNGNKFDTWECQIHLIEKDKFESEKIPIIKSKLTKENRVLLLQLKYWANEVNKDMSPLTKGHFKIQSVWIYDAVLNKGVGTIEDLVETIKTYVPLDYREIYSKSVATV